MGLACKISGHKWNGCTCSRCGEYRDEEHKWVFAAQESKKAQQCREKCSVCGKQRDIEHAWDGCKCSGCGRVRNEGHVFGSFEQAPDGWGNGRGMYYHIGTCKRCGNTYSLVRAGRGAVLLRLNLLRQAEILGIHLLHSRFARRHLRQAHQQSRGALEARLPGVLQVRVGPDRQAAPAFGGARRKADAR